MSANLYDYLKDIVKNTYGMGGIINLIRVEGTDKSTSFNAVDDNRTVVVEAKAKTPIPEFVGIFGMPGLSNLNTILGISEYRDNAKITIAKKDPDLLTGINFENATGDFKNEYRFMSQALANEKLKQVTFKGAKWLVDIVPSVAAIQKFGFQAAANSEATIFTYAVVGTDLIFNFGDHASHTGNFVFATNVKATFKGKHAWPVAVVKNIFALTGDKTIKLSDEGAMVITVDSGLIDYQFIVPAITK